MFVYTANGFTDGAEPNQQQRVLQEGGQPLYRAAVHLHHRRLLLPLSICACVRMAAHGEVCVSLDGGAPVLPKPRAAIGSCRDAHQGLAFSAGDQELGRELLEFVEPMNLFDHHRFQRRRIGFPKRAERHRRKSWLPRPRPPAGLRANRRSRYQALPRRNPPTSSFWWQCLQRLHGGREPWVRAMAATLFALSRLRDKDLLSGVEYSRLGLGLRIPAAPRASPAILR